MLPASAALTALAHLDPRPRAFAVDWTPHSRSPFLVMRHQVRRRLPLHRAPAYLDWPAGQSPPMAWAGMRAQRSF
jgi:hypothetical protein